jgi:Putative peptidoglycan binding domain
MKRNSLLAFAGVVSLSVAPFVLADDAQRSGALTQDPQQSGIERDAGAMERSSAEAVERPEMGGAEQEATGFQQEMHQTDPAVIRQVQQELNERGHNAGPVDGIFGDRTRAALKNYQRSENIDASGRLDQETLASLGVEAEGAAGTASGRDTEQQEAAGTANTGGDAGAEQDSAGSARGEGAEQGAGSTAGAIEGADDESLERTPDTMDSGESR